MNKQKFGFVALLLVLACAQVAAGDPAPAAKDAHDAPAKDAHAAPAKDAHAAPAKDAHAAPAKDAHAAPAKDAHPAPAKDAHGAAAKDSHAAAKDDHGAAPNEAAASKEEPKPAAQKPKRKKPKAKAKAKAEPKAEPKGHGDADHHADAAPLVPASIAPTTRVRTRDRAAAANAVAAEQSSAAHDAHGDGHSATPAAAKPEAHGTAADGHHADAPAAAPAAAASPQAAHDSKAVDTHNTDTAPAVPANIEPTQRQRVRSAVAAKTAPAPAAHADTAHDAPDAKHAANDGAGHDAHHETKHEAKQAAKHDGHADAKHAAAAADAHGSSAHGADECNPPLKAEVAALFDRWNASLRTGDPRKVVANYAPDSVLLPTVSNRARFTIAEKEDYFMHFLQRRPQGYIDDRMIEVDCNSATDAGLYTFRFADGSSVKARYSFTYKKINGQWLITSHHSSGMPEKPEVQPAAHAEAHAAPKPSDSGSSTKGWVRFP